MNIPTLAVVGHPNKGKSSIVSALTEQEHIAISEISGTTTKAQAFDYKISEKTLYTLIDTPGFQRPRQVLELLQSLQPDASQRLSAIKTFIDQYASNPKFNSEIELLEPIVNGASIIYVVDGSAPYSGEYEAEMTILQWTGQARMALINPISGEQFVEQWQQALKQFFNVVQVFNPMQSQTDQRDNMLLAMSVLKPEWQTALSSAQQTITLNEQQIRVESAHLIAEYLQSVLAHSEKLPLSKTLPESATREGLKKSYEVYLKSKEAKLQQQLRTLYAHSLLLTEMEDIKIDFPELFDRNHWYIFGLDRKKIILLTSAAGFATGAALDLGLGGGTFMTGALIGGLGSAAVSTFASDRPDKIKIKHLPLGGEQLQIGPINNIAFAFNLLGRALHYNQAVKSHSHANRDDLSLGDANSDWINALNNRQQVSLTRLLKSASSGLKESERESLAQLLVKLMCDSKNSAN
jgi:GTPase SAR1 family protein